ncbi:MAG: zinc-ribbon domain-containing protein [Methanobacterium sp.]|nr:zinc-ribbon domain-containing protein [Methanobacterium sp.]
MICPKCNTENPDYAIFCQECGEKIEDETPDCPACNTGHLTENIRKGTFNTHYTYQCNYCGAVFEEKSGKYKLTSIQDLDNPIWQKYRNKPLTYEEWARIANGGISNEEQRRMDREEKKQEIVEEKKLKIQEKERIKKQQQELVAEKERDINQFINNLASGRVKLTSSTSSPMILKKNEVCNLVLPNISFLEARSVRQTLGGYGGPSFRVAKGVSFRLGGVSARSVSHDELKKIDQGTLVLTSKRLTFLGSMRTVNIDLRKIVAIEPYKDGIGSQRENKQKTEYFTGTDKTTLTFSNDNRRISIPVNGAVLKAAIVGNIANLG